MTHVGNLLIAPPTIKDSFWHKTVIIVTEHHHHGSIGLVLNKRSHYTIAEFGQQLNIPLNIPGYVYMGGPVNPQSLSLLHSAEWCCSNTMQLNQQFSVSSAEDVLPKLSGGDRPMYWRLFLGMCGWGPGQLVNEIKGVAPYKHQNSWCTASADHDVVFENDSKDQWCKALDRSGSEFSQNILL
jgi:putative transcriptional regulator